MANPTVQPLVLPELVKPGDEFEFEINATQAPTPAKIFARAMNKLGEETDVEGTTLIQLQLFYSAASDSSELEIRPGSKPNSFIAKVL